MSENCDVAVVGAGAAGLMAAIFAARGGARVVALDGAKRLGAKIVISGGGRCNVTHDVVHASDFNGSRNAIAKILRTFDVPATIAFFADLGVTLKREETGKLFPTTDKARTVLDALLRAADGVEIRTGYKVSKVDRGFVINDDLHARKVVLATGGRSVAKTGSDGSGYSLAKALGHTVTPLFPGLVPLVLPDGHPLTTLSGLSVEAELAVRSPTGKVLHRERGSMLFTHFGLSGPVVLDVSRHWIANQPSTLTANLLPGESFDSLDAKLIDSPRSIRQQLPARLWDLLGPKDATREERRRLTRDLLELPLPVVRDRGFDYAEVTAGGVPLSEIDTATMGSRICPGLYLCGEILDVDGRIGGYNFQWAWASGRLAGVHSALY
ncbi:MAG TPA: aminoacetone oxidase family FAD-binding enzyme [Thermoanaerobaculia bacterium]|nr:aminoacetone oxidase family FAD-binding enzyme [Thermoanaerobaculia bacterium]